jgi:signal transduction histidine kinase
VLSDGVHQISAGNLEHRIVYSESDEFRQICDDFNHMAAHLQASIEEVQKNERNRKELLSGISHDLRSPLTSIKAFVEGLQDGVAATPQAQREYLAIIHQKTDDIIGMVSQLFLYSKMDMGSYPNAPERLDIGGELVDFIAASREEYRAKGLHVAAGDMPVRACVYADPVQLRRVFTNILNNSAKYRDKPMAAALVSCARQGNMLRIIFEDDGPGVPEETLPKLFGAFYRGDPSRSSPHQGSGLGLAIAEKTVERMGGGIYAETIEAGGLRVVIELPETEGEA